MRNADLFSASREMSRRVTDYTLCRIMRRKITKEFATRKERIKAQIASLEDEKTWQPINRTKEELVADCQMRIDEYEAQLDQLEKDEKVELERDAKFELTKADKTFKKAIKSVSMLYGQSNETLEKAICEWAANYNLDLTDTTLLRDIKTAIGGKEDWNRMVDTMGYECVSINDGQGLQMLYWTLYQNMVKVGTIKAHQLPSIITENWGKAAKKAKAEARKAAKKAENK